MSDALEQVAFHVDGELYVLEIGRATLLGEELRRAAAGQLGEHGYEAAALSVADAIEAILVGSSDGPVVLEEDAVEAVFFYFNLAAGPSGSEYALYTAVRTEHYRLQEAQEV